jgi:hypothetical protein
MKVGVFQVCDFLFVSLKEIISEEGFLNKFPRLTKVVKIFCTTGIKENYCNFQ